MNNNSNAEPKTSWESPVLYKEDWINTLSGSPNPSPEVDEFNDGPVPS